MNPISIRPLRLAVTLNEQESAILAAAGLNGDPEILNEVELRALTASQITQVEQDYQTLTERCRDAAGNDYSSDYNLRGLLSRIENPLFKNWLTSVWSRFGKGDLDALTGPQMALLWQWATAYKAELVQYILQNRACEIEALVSRFTDRPVSVQECSRFVIAPKVLELPNIDLNWLKYDRSALEQNSTLLAIGQVNTRALSADWNITASECAQYVRNRFGTTATDEIQRNMQLLRIQNTPLRNQSLAQLRQAIPLPSSSWPSFLTSPLTRSFLNFVRHDLGIAIQGRREVTFAQVEEAIANPPAQGSYNNAFHTMLDLRRMSTAVSRASIAYTSLVSSATLFLVNNSRHFISPLWQFGINRMRNAGVSIPAVITRSAGAPYRLSGRAFVHTVAGASREVSKFNFLNTLGSARKIMFTPLNGVLVGTAVLSGLLYVYCHSNYYSQEE